MAALILSDVHQQRIALAVEQAVLGREVKFWFDGVGETPRIVWTHEMCPMVIAAGDHLKPAHVAEVQAEFQKQVAERERLRAARRSADRTAPEFAKAVAR